MASMQVSSHQQYQQGAQKYGKKKNEKATNYHSAEEISLGVTADHLIDYAAHKLLFFTVCLSRALGLV
jgi:hypothetical protein